ncbi:MAG: DUF386 domain-containing protein [Coriobacteriaceae bacterium]|nr:MAG: DUF386 domain-containing protein [Coriobacteriaceae bacterium]
MIYDGMSALERYRGLYKGLDILIDWLRQNDYKTLDLGKHEILGDKVFVNVQNPKTRTYKNAHYEVHHRYLDLQIDVEGNEAFYITSGPVDPIEPFNEEKDKQYVDAAKDNGDETYGTLEKDHFAIFVPGEPHMPNVVCVTAEPITIKKICFKILDDKYWND